MYLNKFNGKSPIRRLVPWIVATLLCTVAGPLTAQEGWRSFYAPDVSALSAVLINPATGEVLFAKEPNLPLPPASTTKVLTAMVALDRLNPNSRLMVSPQAASAPPSRIGLRAGESASAQDLLYGLLLKSGNDAAETLAEAAGGSVFGFSDLMNAKAMQIGARNSHFTNPHGLPNDNHYSTAYDLAMIFRHAMTYPMFADIVRTQSADLRIESGQGLYGDSRVVPVISHNRLLTSYEGARGGKTGFTIKARRCFVGEVDRGGVRLIVAILNSPTSRTLWQDARTLLDYGFARYGLAPSPMQIDGAAQPFMVRRAPLMPAGPTQRVAMVEPALQQWQPGIVSSPAVPASGSRVATTRTGDDLDFTPVRRTTAGVQTSFRPVTPPTAKEDDAEDLDFTPVRPTAAPVAVASRTATIQPTAKLQNNEELDFTPVRPTTPPVAVASRSLAVQPTVRSQDSDEADFTPVRPSAASMPVAARTPAPAARPITKSQDDEDLDFTPVRPTTPVVAVASRTPAVQPTAQYPDSDEVDFTPVRPNATSVPVAARAPAPAARPTARSQDDEDLDFTPVRPTTPPMPVAARTPAVQPTAKFQDSDDVDFTPVRPTTPPVAARTPAPATRSAARYQDDDEVDFTAVRPGASSVPVAARTATVQQPTRYQDAEFNAMPTRPTYGAATAPIAARTTAASSTAAPKKYQDATLVRQPSNAAPITSRTVSDQPSITPSDSATPAREASIAWTTPHETVIDQPAVRVMPESAPNRRTAKARTEAHSPTTQRLASRSDAKATSNRQPAPHTALNSSRGEKPASQPQPRVATATGRSAETANTRDPDAKVKTAAAVATAKPATPSRNAVVVAMATPATKPVLATAKPAKAKPVADMGAKASTSKQASASPTLNEAKRPVKNARAEVVTAKTPPKNAKR